MGKMRNACRRQLLKAPATPGRITVSAVIMVITALIAAVEAVAGYFWGAAFMALMAAGDLWVLSVLVTAFMKDQRTNTVTPLPDTNSPALGSDPEVSAREARLRRLRNVSGIASFVSLGAGLIVLTAGVYSGADSLGWLVWLSALMAACIVSTFTNAVVESRYNRDFATVTSGTVTDRYHIEGSGGARFYVKVKGVTRMGYPSESPVCLPYEDWKNMQIGQAYTSGQK